MLTYKRPFAVVHGTDVLITVEALRELEVTDVTFIRPFLRFHLGRRMSGGSSRHDRIGCRESMIDGRVHGDRGPGERRRVID